MDKELNEPQSIDLVGLIEQPTWKSILLDLVRKEKMDVWAIDLVELSQKYLQRIQELKENNLRIPANAMLACAILLKLKSRTIKLLYEEEEKEELPAIGELPELQPIARIKERTVTLDELLREIEAVIAKTKKKSSATKAVEEVALPMPQITEQDLSSKIEELYGKIIANADEQGLVLFSDIVKAEKPLEVVTAFICLLFLAAKQRINLWQESFFGEIFIAVGNNEADEEDEKENEGENKDTLEEE